MTNTPAELTELNDLAALADIIEANDPPFVGIAPGWWLLAAIALLLLALAGYWIYRKRQQTVFNKALKEARAALASIDVQQPEAAQQINILLKRLVRHYGPNSALLSCSLPEWQDFLQQQQPTVLLPNLTVLLYQPKADPQQTILFADFANSWLRQCDAAKLTNCIREQSYA